MFSVEKFLLRFHFIISDVTPFSYSCSVLCSEVLRLWRGYKSRIYLGMLSVFFPLILFQSEENRCSPHRQLWSSLFWILLIDSIVGCGSRLTPRTLHLQIRSWMKTRKIAAFSLHYKFSSDVSRVISWSVDKSYESYFHFYFLSSSISHPCVQCSQQQKDLYANRYLLVRFMRQNSWACQG
jgi:hypothetical protein